VPVVEVELLGVRRLVAEIRIALPDRNTPLEHGIRPQIFDIRAVDALAVAPGHVILSLSGRSKWNVGYKAVRPTSRLGAGAGDLAAEPLHPQPRHDGPVAEPLLEGRVS
jgi:hypothetical protein